jgi:hypothetical protein
MLRETKGLNEAGLSVEDLPLLAKCIRIIHDDFTVTGNVVPRLVLALLAALLAKCMQSKVVSTR